MCDAIETHGQSIQCCISPSKSATDEAATIRGICVNMYAQFIAKSNTISNKKYIRSHGPIADTRFSNGIFSLINT